VQIVLKRLMFFLLLFLSVAMQGRRFVWKCSEIFFFKCIKIIYIFIFFNLFLYVASK
jgi:hypothetical protein